MKIVGIIIIALFVMVGAMRNCLKKRPINANYFLDLTYPFDATTLGYPGLKPFELVITHRGFTDAGYWLQTEDYSGAIHVGTHIDAPCHIVEGQWKLEQIPLERFMAPAAVVDISNRSKEDKDANLEVGDLIDWEKQTNKSLDGIVVLVNSGWGEKWGNEKDFLGSDTPTDTSTLHFPGVSPEAAESVSKNRKIYGLGIDTTSLDNGQAVHRKAHQALFRANIYGLENVANLHMLPASGAFVFVFPMRIKEACGSPTRIIALVPNTN